MDEKVLSIMKESIKLIEDDFTDKYIESDDGRKVLHDIYSYALYQMDQFHQRKRHIETKGLYLLQGQIILVSIYSAISWNSIDSSSVVLSLRVLSMGIMAISIILSVLVQKDNILSNRVIKCFFKVFYKNKIKIEDGFYDIPTPVTLINYSKKYRSSVKYYEGICDSINESINSLNNINMAKNIFVNISINIFILSLLIIGALYSFV